jgi:phosphoribosylformylglycinamidine synthase
MYVAEVRINLKKGVADPEGENTKKTLELLGFKDITEVKSIKTFEIHLNAKSKEESLQIIEEVCKKLLANPVIHNYSIKISR